MTGKNGKYLFTSESVSAGHPDKVCDQISDAVLDACLAQDPFSRVACETGVKNNRVFLLGEITTGADIDLDGIVRATVNRIGYTPECGFDASCAITKEIIPQSPDIAQGVDRDGAGDQGMMFGYAINETPEFMPLSIMLAHKLLRELDSMRRSGEIPYALPDAKSQVTLEYKEGKPHRVDAVVVSTHHKKGIEHARIEDDVVTKLILPVCKGLTDSDTHYFVNPTGKFEVGGPVGDSGVTGRKIIVDTYGGHGAHGGGAFSGKDPTKVDRSAAYAARYIAKNIVAAGLADRCLVQLAYAIGVAQPVSIRTDCFGTNSLPESRIVELVSQNFPLTPRAILTELDLRKPIFERTASYGHFGREEEGFTWERTDKADLLRRTA